MKKNNENKELLFDIIETGQKLFSEDKMYEGYIYIRERLDLSEISNDEIKDVLLGEISLFWENSEYFFIIDKPNLRQKERNKKIEEKYKNVLSLLEENYEILKTMDYDFFKSISPRVFQDNTLYPTSLVKSFMFNCEGDYFYVKNNDMFFLIKQEKKGFNPYLKH